MKNRRLTEEEANALDTIEFLEFLSGMIKFANFDTDREYIEEQIGERSSEIRRNAMSKIFKEKGNDE